MCYISVGTWENWRPDASKFPQSVIGDQLAGYPNEDYLDVRSPVVRAIMVTRFNMVRPPLGGQLYTSLSMAWDALLQGCYGYVGIEWLVVVPCDDMEWTGHVICS